MNDILISQKLLNLFAKEGISMFNAVTFGEKLKEYRKHKNLTQDDVAGKIGVSSQAVSKWEKGECLPDVYNLRLIGQLYRISIDNILDMENVSAERIIETVRVGGAVFEIVEKPQVILAGKILYAKGFGSIEKALESINENERWLTCDSVIDCVLPVSDITVSINFWMKEKARAIGFVIETTNDTQPVGVDVYKMPSSLFIRAYTDKNTAQLLSKNKCEIWELFAYIRNYFMPVHGFKMAENGAQEMEVFDTPEHKSGFAYMPVMRTK